jgi:hypothetical protein
MRQGPANVPPRIVRRLVNRRAAELAREEYERLRDAILAELHEGLEVHRISQWRPSASREW